MTGDTDEEQNETVVAMLSNAANATISTATGTGTIVNDDGVTVSIDSPSVTEGDSGSTNLTFTATLSKSSTRQVTVNYADAGTGTATSGTDYTAITGGTLTFAAGTTSQTFNVSVTGDTDEEADETVVVTLSNAANATISTATGTGTITDNDRTPSLSIDSPSVTEGDSGSKNLRFTVTLNRASTQQVTVDYADAGTGTATSGTDYAAITVGSLTFAAGDDQPDLQRVGDGRHDRRGGRDGSGDPEQRGERDDLDGHRNRDDHGQRRRADAVDQLAERDRGGQRLEEPDVHGDVERGERQAGDGGTGRRGPAARPRPGPTTRRSLAAR